MAKKIQSQFLTQLTISPLLFGLIAAGIGLRIAGLTTSALWYDEVVSVFNVRLPFFTMIQATKYTNTPPIWEIMLWVSVHIFGENEFAIRLPSLLVSILALWLTYRLTIDFGFSNVQQHIAMLFVSLLPFQFWIAQDGRVYATLAALYLAAIWFAIRQRWLGLTACAGLLLYTHFSAPFYLAALYGVTVFNHGISWKNIKHTLISGLIISIAFIPWLSALSFSLQNQIELEPFTLYYLLHIFYQALFVSDIWRSGEVIAWVYLGSILITSVATLLFATIRLIKEISIWQQIRQETQNNSNERQRYMQLTLFALAPLAGLIVISLFSKNVIYYRVLSGMLVPFIIWVVYTLGHGLKPSLLKYGFVTLWLFLLFASIVNWSPASKGGNLRSLTNLIYKEWKTGDVIYHITGTSYLPFSYYLPDKPTYLLDEAEHAFLLPGELADIYGLQHISLESLSYKRVWVIYVRDDLLSATAKQRAQNYIRDGIPVGQVTAWQFAPINVYLVTPKTP